MKRLFTGRPPGVVDSDDGSSEDEEEVREKETVISAPSKQERKAAPRRRPRVQAKVLDSAGTEEPPQVTSGKRRRKKIEAKVILSEGVEAGDNDGAHSKNLPSFVSVDKERLERDEEQLPDLHVVDDYEGSESSSGSEESDTNSSASEDGSQEYAHHDNQDYEEKESSAKPLAPVYVSSKTHSENQRRALELLEKRKLDAYKRKREACNEVLLASRHTVEETEYDLKHVDMTKFPDDTDKPDEFEEEYALWRVRELKRVMRDRGLLMGEDEENDVEPPADVANDDDAVKELEVPATNGDKTFKVGAFFAEKKADGRYVQELYNRDFQGQEEPESVQIRKKTASALSTIKR